MLLLLRVGGVLRAPLSAAARALSQSRRAAPCALRLRPNSLREPQRAQELQQCDCPVAQKAATHVQRRARAAVPNRYLGLACGFRRLRKRLGQSHGGWRSGSRSRNAGVPVVCCCACCRAPEKHDPCTSKTQAQQLAGGQSQRLRRGGQPCAAYRRARQTQWPTSARPSRRRRSTPPC